jgi:class 3 adenylate cyclase/tetratricopeptide (TPR) repeat protein
MQCPQCRQANVPTARFCNACGSALGNAPAEASPGERRQLTVLFCDLVGSTALSGQLDPEDWREVVRAYQQAAADVVVRYAGHVAQYLGDGLLIYFGYPEAHENDAERAVRAGLELLAAVAAVENRPLGVKLGARIGIHTGPVVVGELGSGGRAETLALGETPNVSARVQALAEPDTLLITGATHGLVAGRFVVDAQGTHTLKGVREPVALYRVLRPSGARGRLEAAQAQRLTPFVGREDERGMLWTRWQRARDGEGQVVLVSGEAGIGKSRLVQALKEQLAGEPHTWIESGGSPYHQNTPFYAVVDLLERLLAWRGDESPEERMHGLEERLVLAGLSPADAVPLLAPLLSLALPERHPPSTRTREAQRRDTFAALAAWTCGAAKLQPMVFVLEDLHWVDPSTLELLATLAEQAATVPLLLVFTARPEFRAPWPLLGHHAHLSLNRLTRAQVREMVEQVSARAALPAGLMETVIARTDGVPLFIEELTKSVVEGRGSALPMTLEDSLRARLDRLGSAKEVAQLGSVIGREFSYALLHAVSPLSEAELQSALTQLCAAELLYARGQPPEARYVFKHALVQDAAYASLLKSRRRELHRAIASTLADAFPESTPSLLELLAHHHTEAGDTELAVAAWQRAGEQAAARSAYEEAIGHSRQALALLATLPESRERHAREIALQVALGRSISDGRGLSHDEIEPAMERARVLSEMLGDQFQLVLALAGLANYCNNRGQLDRAIAFAQQMIEIARNADAEFTGFGIWAGHLQLVMAESYQGHFTASLQHSQRMATEHGSRPSWLLASQSVGMSGFTAWDLWALGYPSRALREAQETVAIGRMMRHRSLAVGMVFAGHVHERRRDSAAQRELAEELIALCKAQGILSALEEGRVLQASALAATGDVARALAEASDAVSRLVGTSVIGVARGLSLLAPIQLAAGRHKEALATVEEALAISEQTGARNWDAELHRLKGEIARLDDQKLAEECFHCALEIARSQDARSLELRAATSLARLLHAQGKPREARALLAPIYAWFTEGFDTGDLIDAKALLDELR